MPFVLRNPQSPEAPLLLGIEIKDEHEFEFNAETEDREQPHDAWRALAPRGKGKPMAHNCGSSSCGYLRIRTL